MTQESVFEIVAPIINAWNATHTLPSDRLSAVLDDGIITIAPVESNHLPGSVLSDIAMLAAVYNLNFGVWTNNCVPFILL